MEKQPKSRSGTEFIRKYGAEQGLAGQEPEKKLQRMEIHTSARSTLRFSIRPPPVRHKNRGAGVQAGYGEELVLRRFAQCAGAYRPCGPNGAASPPLKVSRAAGFQGEAWGANVDVLFLPGDCL